MRILIVNRERAHASLLTAALKRLGHRGEWCEPGDALGRITGDAFDGAITEADHDSIALAGALRRAAGDLPIALAGDLAGPPPSGTSVLPRVWTVVDLRRVVDDFDAEHRRLAKGSMPAAEFELDDELELTPPPQCVEELPATPPRAQPDRLVLSCRSWAKVERLCEEAALGRPRIAVHGTRTLVAGQRLHVRVRLPDELVLSFPAEVVTATPGKAGRSSAILELGGVQPDRLRALLPTR